MPERKTLYHRADPATSRDAAAKMIKSGKLARQEREVLRTIENRSSYGFVYSDFTAKELSAWDNSDYFVIQRRLSGLRRKGKIERTGQKRDGCCVWRLTK